MQTGRRVPSSLLLALLIAAVSSGSVVFAQDLDGDGIADAVEETLADRFAPHLVLHPDEEHRPATVPWYLSQLHANGVDGGLRFHHDGGCTDHAILATPTVATLIGQSHKETGGWPFCNHDDDLVYNSGSIWTTVPFVHIAYTTPFFLQIPTNDGDSGPIHVGLNASLWRAYVHVSASRTEPDHYDVQYIWFFPYNDDTAGFGAHEGDFEHVTVRVMPDQLTIDEIRYSAHGSGGEWWGDPRILYHPVTGRPIVYSAVNSHALYPNPGIWATDAFIDQVEDGGESQDMLGRLDHVGEIPRPRPGQEWIQYNGRWGKIGVADLTGPGPQTPSFQRWWKLEEIDDNPPPSTYRYVCSVGFDTPAPQGVYTPYSTVPAAEAGAPAGSTVWLQDWSYGDLTPPTYVLPPGFVFDKHLIWRTGVSGPVLITGS